MHESSIATLSLIALSILPQATLAEEIPAFQRGNCGPILLEEIGRASCRERV